MAGSTKNKLEDLSPLITKMEEQWREPVGRVAWMAADGHDTARVAGAWTVREQNRLLAHCFGLPAANKA
jgi:hypothetical protein